MGEGQDSKRLTWALILNALVLPGSGHVSIGATAKGLLIAAATMVFLIAAITRFFTAFQSALVSGPPRGAGASLGFLAAAGRAWSAHGGFMAVCLFAVLLLWAYGVADIAWRIRRGRANETKHGGKT